MSQGSGNFKVSIASRKIRSVSGVMGGMFVPVASVERRKRHYRFRHEKDRCASVSPLSPQMYTVKGDFLPRWQR
jgi:hypothetical protein